MRSYCNDPCLMLDRASITNDWIISQIFMDGPIVRFGSAKNKYESNVASSGAKISSFVVSCIRLKHGTMKYLHNKCNLKMKKNYLFHFQYWSCFKGCSKRFANSTNEAITPTNLVVDSSSSSEPLKWFSQSINKAMNSKLRSTNSPTWWATNFPSKFSL